MTDPELALLAVAAILGMLLNAILGWLDSNEPFILRKFVPSVLRGIVAALLVVVVIPSTQVVGLTEYFLAFLSGAGVDAVGHTASSISGVRNRLTPKTK